jgi:uncharacterized membrane protein
MTTSDRSHRAADERGQVIVLLVVALLGVMGMLALVVDLGYLYWNQLELQSSADAAALAGAMELPDRLKAEARRTTAGWAQEPQHPHGLRRRVGDVRAWFDPGATR